MYERALAQQRLDARRQRYGERLRVLLVVFGGTALIFFVLFVR